MKPLRCAIYTRKSSEEGLEQSFNSLQAQREACEAYILSQAHEGWSCLAAHYDDGGFSGGSLDRPGLKSLLADIASGRVDVVVVYKVDRLTRSLADFAKIVEAFDAKAVSFVSVTQAFNTTTSMGRLTLNVLLSFAQFEREVTGERIRDKIAASKAKGMWMGGNLPLGYDARDRALIVNEVEAEQVRSIFRRYLELGSVHRLAEELEHQGVRSKVRVSRRGRTYGGETMSRGALFHLLQNRHYLGEIRHKEKSYPGQHPAIVDRELFDRVQASLQDNRIKHRGSGTRAAKARLVGRLFTASGAPFSPSFGYGQGGKLYRYYVSSGGQAADGEGTPRRLPATELEAFVLDRLRTLTDRTEESWDALEGALDRVEVRASEVHLLIGTRALLPSEHPEFVLRTVRSRLSSGEEALAETSDGARLRVVIPARLVFRGGRTWIVDHEGRPARRLRRQDLTLAAALRNSHAILQRQGLNAVLGEVQRDARSPKTIYEFRLARLALLSPSIQRMILEGRHPRGLTLQSLIGAEPPLCWRAQESWLVALAQGG